MPTTSNFGWTTPADTDLVKDGAAAIRTLGNGIDTSFIDLKGGTTGQILSKASNTDLDFSWVANDQGDITAVTAGTGITGGGTTGAVTITNDMATTITASGDIIVGTGNATYDNLPIGTTGQVLTADTTVSPYKVKWATPASGTTFAGASVRQSSAQSINDSTWTSLAFNAENFDTDAYHDNSTNNTRITIPSAKGGYYQCNVQAMIDSSAAGRRIIKFIKNGTDLTPEGYHDISGTNPGNAISWTLSQVISLAVGDYLEVQVYQATGGARNTQTGATLLTVGYLGA